MMPLVLRRYKVMDERLAAEGLGIRMVATRLPLPSIPARFCVMSNDGCKAGER